MYVMPCLTLLTLTAVTVELIRSRAEHNDKEIFSLEEVSLHQQNIEKFVVCVACCHAASRCVTVHKHHTCIMT